MKNDAMKNAPAGENERPLMLAPAFKDYIWGGERLKRDWGKQTDLSPLAESWELSCHEAGPSVVASGEWAGRTLAQVLDAHPQFVGTKAEKAGEFPLLIKLIDAAGPLSVQVLSLIHIWTIRCGAARFDPAPEALREFHEFIAHCMKFNSET